MKTKIEITSLADASCLLVLLAMTSNAAADGADHHHKADAVSAFSSASSADTWQNSGSNRHPLSISEDTLQFPFRSRVIQAAQNTLGQPAVFGQWSDVMSWPVIAVHANLLPNGKVLAWDATPDDLDDDPHTTENFTTRVTLWDPQNNSHVATNNDTNSDLFCAGSAHLWDGRVLFAGGDSGRARANAPLANTSIYDPVTNTWRQVANMAAPRWYSSVAALANGEMLTFAGNYSPNPAAEVFQFDETWRTLAVPTPADLSVDYQWMQATPEGEVMTFGPQSRISTIDPAGSGLLTAGRERDGFPERRYGSYAMYDIGVVLVAGGTKKEGGDPSYRSAVIIDTATQQTTDTGSLGTGRTQHNLTILADGSVLATGGNSDGAALVSVDAGVFRPEIWSPDTGQWRYLNDMQVDRQYHSIALLLPDGRVLSAGGGYCGTCTEVGYEEQNAEIFSPPYLFSDGDTLATRPSVSSAPARMDYALEYTVSSDQSSRISKAHLIKLGAVTHSQNQDQRLVPLSFQRSGNALAITAPANRNIAPPGHYLLFLINDDGVPSVGKIIQVGQPLLTSGATVTNAIRSGESDQFSIEASATDATLLVRVAGVAAQTSLTVVGQAQNGQTTAQCNANSGSAQAVECSLSNQVATRWLISVDAAANTSYDLVATLSTVVDPNAEQPDTESETTDQNTTGSVVSGGGAMAGIFLWLIAVVHVARRRRS